MARIKAEKPTVYTPPATAALMENLERYPNIIPEYQNFTKREKEFIRIYAIEGTYADVARRLGLQRQSVYTYVKSKPHLKAAMETIRENTDKLVNGVIGEAQVNAAYWYLAATDPDTDVNDKRYPPLVKQKAAHDIFEATGMFPKYEGQNNTQVNVTVKAPAWKEPVVGVNVRDSS